MKKLFVKLAAIALLAAFSVASIQAQDAKKDEKPVAPAAPAAHPQPKSLPLRGKLKAVDTKAKTVTLSGKTDRTFVVTSKTHIIKEGKPVTLEDVKVGDEVSGSYRDAEDGKHNLNSLFVGMKPHKTPPAPPAPAAPAEKK